MFLAGEDKWRARRYAVANVALALATTLFMVRISYAQRNFQTALSGKDEGEDTPYLSKMLKRNTNANESGECVLELAFPSFGSCNLWEDIGCGSQSPFTPALADLLLSRDLFHIAC